MVMDTGADFSKPTLCTGPLKDMQVSERWWDVGVAWGRVAGRVLFRRRRWNGRRLCPRRVGLAHRGCPAPHPTRATSRHACAHGQRGSKPGRAVLKSSRAAVFFLPSEIAAPRDGARAASQPPPSPSTPTHPSMPAPPHTQTHPTPTHTRPARPPSSAPRSLAASPTCWASRTAWSPWRGRRPCSAPRSSCWSAAHRRCTPSRAATREMRV
jgi:hypothetical protein